MVRLDAGTWHYRLNMSMSMRISNAHTFSSGMICNVVVAVVTVAVIARIYRI